MADEWDGSIPDETEEVIDEAPETEPQSSSGTDDDAAAEVAEQAALIFGKYKSIEEAEKGYKELERQFHDSRQQPQPQVEDDEDEYQFDPAFATEEAQTLIQHAATGPHEAKEAFDYAVQNAHVFGRNADRVQDELFQMWSMQSPRAAARYEAQQMFDEYRQQFASEMQPLQGQYTQQVIDLAVHSASKDLHGFDEHAQEVLERIQAQPALVKAINENPEYRSHEAIAGLLKQVYATVVLDNFLQAQAAAAQADTATQVAPATKPKTSTRSTSPKPAGDGDYDLLFGAGAFEAAS